MKLESGFLGQVGQAIRDNVTVKNSLTTVALVAAIGFGLLAVHITKGNPQSLGGFAAGAAAVLSAGVAFGAGLQSAFKERKKEEDPADRKIAMDIYNSTGVIYTENF